MCVLLIPKKLLELEGEKQQLTIGVVSLTTKSWDEKIHRVK
jgi:hypothetical protein